MQMYRYTKRTQVQGTFAMTTRIWRFRYPPEAEHDSSQWEVDDQRIWMLPSVVVAPGDGAVSRIADLPGYVLQAIYTIEPVQEKTEPRQTRGPSFDVPAPKRRLVINCEGDWEP